MSNSVDNNVKAFFQGTAIFTVASVLTKVAQILLLPLISDHLSPEQLGIADMIQMLYSFLYPVLVMGFDAAFGAFYFEQSGKEYQRRVFNTIFFHLVCMSGIAAVGMLFSQSISQFLFHSPAYAEGILVSLLTLMVCLWIVPFSQYLRMEKRMKAFSAVTLVGSFTLLMANFFFVVYAQWGYFALVISIFLSYVIQLFLFFLLVRPRLSLSYIDCALYRRILRYALPLVPMLIIGWALQMSDRFLLNRMVGDVEVGLYGVAARFQTILTMATSVIFTTFSAFAFSSRNEKQAAESFRLVHNLLHSILFLAAFTASLFAENLLSRFINAAYFRAAPAVAPLLFGQVCYASHTIFSYGFAFEKKSYLNLLPTGLGATVNIALNLILIPRYGAVAAAYTTFIGYALMMLVTYGLAKRVYPCHYDLLPTLMSLFWGMGISVWFASAGLTIKFVLLFVTVLGMFVLYRHTIAQTIAMAKRMKDGQDGNGV